jgi:hypothetical protein
MNKRLAIFLMVSLLVMGLTQVVMAITAPTSGSFAYDIYDIVVNKMLKGPVGFVSGLAAIAFGAVNLIQARIMTALLFLEVLYLSRLIQLQAPSGWFFNFLVV